jgi:hypothetical protein
MAIEDAFVYLLAEVPTLLLAKVLGRRFSLPHKKAQAIATYVFFALILGACFLAWFTYQNQYG